MKGLVSVIIPTFNSEKTLERCLESVKSQSYKNIEIIVVDKFSNDRTVKIARKYTRKVYQIKASERSEQRNCGARKARGEYLCFIDSDMELSEKVIESCVNNINENSGLIIPEETKFNNFWGKVRYFERSFYLGNNLIEAARFFVKKDFFVAGMYDLNLTGQEDWELPIRMKKMGFKIGRVKDYIYHNEENFSLWKNLKKKYYYSKTFNNYIKKHKDFSLIQINPFYRFWIFFRNKRFYSKPLLAFGVILLKTMEYFFVGVGSLVSRVRR